MAFLSLFDRKYGRTADRMANQSTPPQEPAAKREGRVHSASQCLVSSRADGTTVPGHFTGAAELRRQPKGVFRGEAPELIFPTFVQGQK